MVTALGYKGLADVEREFYIPETKDRGDYVLKEDGQKRVGIEAKSVKHELTDGDAGQLVQYCRVVGIEWAVVSKGPMWWVYQQCVQLPLEALVVQLIDVDGW